MIHKINLKNKAGVLALLLLALVSGMGLSSCVHQFPEEDTIGNVYITVLQDTEWLPDSVVTLTRAGETDVNIRYDFRLYRKGNTNDIIKEFSIVKDDLTRQDFKTQLELMPGDYDLYCWSDYVDAKTGKALYYDDSDFADITYIKPYEGDTDLRDAFRGMTTFTVEGSGYAQIKPVEATITLTRPLARYKFIATDLAEFIENEITRGKMTNEPASGPYDAQRWAKLSDYTVRVVYPLYMPAVFNNFRNNPVDSWTGVSFNCQMQQLNADEAQLCMDYTYVNGNESSVQVQLEVYDAQGGLIARTNTITVPTKRDRTTLVYGKFLTTIRSDGVGINPDFEGEYNIEIK